jgi:hypothetical protein
MKTWGRDHTLLHPDLDLTRMEIIVSQRSADYERILAQLRGDATEQALREYSKALHLRRWLSVWHEIGNAPQRNTSG